MENKEQLFEDLQYIKQIVNDSRNLVIERGVEFIVWGLIIVVGLVYTYIDVLVQGNLRNDIVWVVLIAGGWLYSIVMWFKYKDKENVSTFSGRLLGSLWLSAGIAMTIFGFAGTISGAYGGVFVSPVIATLLGVAFFVSAQIYNDSLMKKLSPLWWVGALYMFFFPGIETLLIMAIMMLVLQVLPGFLFYRKYKSEQKANG